MALTLANQARTSLLTFIHNESLCTLKSRPEIKINGRSPTEMLRSFENIEITINNPIETGFASRSGRMKSSYRYLNDIIIHSEEEEVDESFIEEDNFIMKQKTIVSEKKINKKDYSLNTTTTNSNVTNSKQKKRTKCHKSNSLSDSGEISSNKNVDYIKHSYSLLRKLSNLLKKRKVCMTNTNNNTNTNTNTSNCTNKKPNKHPHNESFSSRHNMTTPSNKDKNNLSHTNNNNNTTNKNFSPNSNRSYCIKESDFHINLHKLTTDNNNNNNNNTHNNSSNKHTHTKHNSINNSQITQSSTSLSETCDSSISQQPKMRKTKHKHTSNTNINSSIKPKPPLYSNRKSFVDHPTSFHAKIFAESS